MEEDKKEFIYVLRLIHTLLKESNWTEKHRKLYPHILMYCKNYKWMGNLFWQGEH